jgi:hypothetical protein
MLFPEGVCMNRSCLAVVGLLMASPAAASIATFDEFPEGLIGESFISGGIKFYGALNDDNKPEPLYADDVSASLKMKALADHFSPPNILTVGNYVEGETGWGMGGFIRLLMTRGGLETSARMDLFYRDTDTHAGNVVSLEALLDGKVVATDSFVIPGLDSPTHVWREMAIEGVAFDTLRLSASGDVFDHFFGSLDNVEIVPAPGAWACLAAGGLLLPRRRR